MTDTFTLDSESERLAQEVAKATGKPVADVVRDAIVSSAREAGVVVNGSRLSPEDKLRRLKEIAERSAARQVLDARSADEILDYDEHGLPR